MIAIAKQDGFPFRTAAAAAAQRKIVAMSKALAGTVSAGLGAPIADGFWAGWSTWHPVDPFEEYVGPFHARREDAGGFVCGFRPQAHNANGSGAVHGGALMSFADYALFMIACDALAGRQAVTISCNSEFVGAAWPDKLLTARGEVLRTGKGLLFVRGLVDHDGHPVLNFSGIIKVMRAGD